MRISKSLEPSEKQVVCYNYTYSKFSIIVVVVNPLREKKSSNQLEIEHFALTSIIVI